MKKLVFFVMAGSFAAASTIMAQPGADLHGNHAPYAAGEEMQRVAVPGHRRLAHEVRQLNRYRAHVSSKMRAYGANRAQWREMGRITTDVDRINRRFRYTYYTPGNLNGQIRVLRHRLRHLERTLRFRERDVFIWGNLG